MSTFHLTRMPLLVADNKLGRLPQTQPKILACKPSSGCLRLCRVTTPHTRPAPVNSFPKFPYESCKASGLTQPASACERLLLNLLNDGVQQSRAAFNLGDYTVLSGRTGSACVGPGRRASGPFLACTRLNEAGKLKYSLRFRSFRS